MTRRRMFDKRSAIDDLVTGYLSGNLSRRHLLTRAAALGISVPALSAAFTLRTGAQGTPEADLQLGNYADRTLRISLALAESERQVFQDVIVEGFREQTEGSIDLITIESEDLVRTLQAQVDSGNIEIDLLTVDNNTLAPLVANQLVEEIAEATEIIPPETIEGLIEVLQFDGTYYFLPARPNVQITYYNERILNDFGVMPPQTWDELMAGGQTIQEQSGVGRLSIQGVPGGAVGVTCTQFIWQAGGDPLDLGTEQAAAAYQFMQDLKPYLTPQYPTATFDTTNTYLLNESVVLAQNWPFGINVIVGEGGKEEVKAYEGWEGPAGNFLVLGGDVFGIVRGTENRDMAIDFARFFMTREVQETLTAQLAWPASRTDAFGAVEEWQQPYFDAVNAALANARPRPNLTFWPEVELLLGDAFNDIVTNEQDVAETLQRYNEDLQALQSGG